jgi:HEAT repeat protein
MGDAAAPGLIAALKDEDWKVRRSAADALWGLREPSAVEALAEAMTDRNDVVRQAATGAMEQMGEGAVTGLVNVLKTSSGPIKQVAAQMLQKIGSPTALQALQQATAPLPPKPTRSLDNRR